eukprot:GHVU01008769.1.p1 GENE.GHVU01008769.1~~GHVU01008769.1.p1  ORF type:complete len:138 (-),score=13.84 GHVU01008769.1:76-489(-)
MRACVSFTHPTGLNCVRGITAPLVPARSIRLKIGEDLTWDVNDKRLFTKVNPVAINSATYTALDELLKQESTRKSFIKEDERQQHEETPEYKQAHENFYEAITATRTIADTFELVTARSFCLTELVPVFSEECLLSE